MTAFLVASFFVLGLSAAGFLATAAFLTFLGEACFFRILAFGFLATFLGDLAFFSADGFLVDGFLATWKFRINLGSAFPV